MRVERTQRRADVAQQRHADLQDERHVAQSRNVAQRIPVFDPVVARIRLGELRKLPVVPPELARIHDHAADRGAVAADVFRGRGRQDVHAVVERPDQPDAHRVVGHHRNAVVVRDLRDGLEIRHVQLRIADGLDVDRPGLVVDRLPVRFRIARIDELHLAAQPRERVVEQLVGPAVEVVARHDLVAHLRDRQQGVGDRRLARGHAQRARAAFERGHPLLEDVRRRVHQPRVDVAEFLQREEIRRVLAVAEDVRRRLVDRHRPRARRRVGLLAGMEGQCMDSWFAHVRCSCIRFFGSWLCLV